MHCPRSESGASTQTQATSFRADPVPTKLPVLSPHQLRLHTRQDLFSKVVYCASISTLLETCQAQTPRHGAEHGIFEPNLPDAATRVSVPPPGPFPSGTLGLFSLNHTSCVVPPFQEPRKVLQGDDGVLHPCQRLRPCWEGVPGLSTESQAGQSWTPSPVPSSFLEATCHPREGRARGTETLSFLLGMRGE